MDNPLMDKNAVASYIGGITPRVARELMRSMPCVNVASGSQKPRLRVFQRDLDEWLANRKRARADAQRAKARKKTKAVGIGLDDAGYVMKKRDKN